MLRSTLQRVLHRRAHGPPSLLRHLVTGAATADGLSSRVPVSPLGAAFYETFGRTGWPVSRLGFGSDDAAASVIERAGLLHTAILRKGVNIAMVEGDHVFLRRQWDSGHFTPVQLERDWEQYSLAKLLRGGRVDRSALAIVARLSVPLGAPNPAAALGDRVHALLVALDLQALDVLLLHVPQTMPQPELRALCAELEALVGGGFLQYYGISSEGFHAASAGTAHDWGAVPVAGISLPGLLATAESLRGVAAASREASLRRGAGRGNQTSYPLGTGLGGSDLAQQGDAGGADTAEPESDGLGLIRPPPPAFPAPGPRDHHLIAISYPRSIAAPATESATVELQRLTDAAGLVQLLRSPFDAVLRLPEGGTLLGDPEHPLLSDRGGDGPEFEGGQGAGAALPLRARPFRCVAPALDSAAIDAAASLPPPAASQSGGEDAGDAFADRREQARLLRLLQSHGVVSPRQLEALEEGVSAAIHMELLWGSQMQRRTVREAVGGAEAGVAPQVSDAPSWVEAQGLPEGVQRQLRSLFPGLQQHQQLAGASLSAADSGVHTQALPPHDTESARSLAGSLPSLDNWLEWRLSKGRTIRPALARLAAVCEAAEEPRQWAHAYTSALTAAGAQLDALIDAAQAKRVRALAAELGRRVPGVAAVAPALAYDDGDVPAATSEAAAAVPELVTGLLLAAHPHAVLLTESPAAFGVRRKAEAEIRRQMRERQERARQQRSESGASEQGVSADVEEEEEGGEGRGEGGAAAAQKAADDAEAAAAAARRAARAAELDALIASCGSGGDDSVPPAPSLSRRGGAVSPALAEAADAGLPPSADALEEPESEPEAEEEAVPAPTLEGAPHSSAGGDGQPDLDAADTAQGEGPFVGTAAGAAGLARVPPPWARVSQAEALRLLQAIREAGVLERAASLPLQIGTSPPPL